MKHDATFCTGRRLRYVGVVVALTALVTSQAAWADAAVDDDVLLSDLARDAFAPRRIALLVAVERVDDGSFPPLTFAEQDAQRLHAALGDADQGRFDDVILLVGATRSEFREALADLMRRVRRQDTVLIYFSGHGLADDSSPPRLMLALRDTSMGTIGDSGVPLDAVQDVMQALDARRKVLLVDACFTADGKQGDLAGGVPAEVQAEAPLLQTDLPADEAHLLSAGFGRPAFELSELQGSLYTTHFVDGLLDLLADVDGDGVVTVSEAHDHAAGAAVEGSGGVQVPLALYRISGREDLILSGDPGLRSAPTLALLTTYDRRHAGLGVEVDGKAKGVFPRSIPVEPGVRSVRLIAPSGRVVDRGTFRFGTGQVVSAERVRSALNGGYRLFHVGPSIAVLPGPGSDGLNAAGPAIHVGLGHRGRGVVGRHLLLRGDFGFAVIPGAQDSTWPMFGLGVEGALRADPKPLTAEIGPRVELALLLPLGGPTTESPAVLMLVPGGHAALGVRLGNLVALKLRYRLGVTHADLRRLGEPSVVTLQRLGMELEVGW